MSHLDPNNEVCMNQEIGEENEIHERAPINWVERGAVTDVINQGQCGASWAIGTTGAIEGAYYVWSGTQKDLRSISVQQILDCDEVGANSCYGGSTESALAYALNTPLEEGDDYEYKATLEPCAFDRDMADV